MIKDPIIRSVMTSVHVLYHRENGNDGGVHTLLPLIYVSYMSV